MLIPCMVTLNSACATFPAMSVAVYRTVVTPIGNDDPDTWLDVRVIESELRETVGCVQCTVAVAHPSSVVCVIFSGTPMMFGP